MDITSWSITVSIAVGLALTSTPPAAPAEENLDEVGLGSCFGSNGPVELRRAMFLENRVLDFDGPSGPVRVSLLGQRVRIESIGPTAERSTYAQDVGSAVAQGEEDADVQLKLAFLDGRLVLYWRETFLHRVYRQGLFSIDGQNLTPLCEGRGGAEVSH